MDKKSTVTINGRLYDALTGLPIEDEKEDKPAGKTSRRPAPSGAHKSPQRSQTLNRRLARKSRPTSKPTQVAKPTAGRTMDIARNPHVSKFSKPHATNPGPAKTSETPDKSPSTHPIAKRAMKRHQDIKKSSSTNLPQKTSKEIKEEAISKALNAPTAKQDKEPGLFRRHSKKVALAIILTVVIGVGGYLAYVNLPVLSVNFASYQAGIEASYPSYTPNGYHLQQPISYSDGEVELTFSSNTGAGDYVIKQARSSWDSSAVLSNVVEQAVDDDYVVTQDGGLTIYSYQGNAAWVNGGILFLIESNAPLSGDQLRSVATSL